MNVDFVIHMPAKLTSYANYQRNQYVLAAHLPDKAARLIYIKTQPLFLHLEGFVTTYIKTRKEHCELVCIRALLSAFQNTNAEFCIPNRHE